MPVELGGAGGPGTNPEQLFAVGYAACFQSALLRLASGRNLDLGKSRVTARVWLGPVAAGGLGLAVALDLDSPQLGRADAAELMVRAHDACPYSRATRGNIDVELMVGGQPIAAKRRRTRTTLGRERSYGSFSRSMALPPGVDAKKVKATTRTVSSR